MGRLILRGARLLDPGLALDAEGSVAVRGGLIEEVALGARITATDDDEVIDLRGRWLVPGLLDLRSHLREPGFEHKEDILSGLRAAAAGGYSAVCALPATSPVMDCAAVVAQVRERAAAAQSARLLPVGAITQGLDDETLAPIAELRDEGCVAVTQGEHPLRSAQLMRRALEYCRGFDMLVMSSAVEPTMAGLCHEGAWSTRLGLPATPGAAEAIAISRDLALAELTGARLHLSRVSTARGLALIAEAKARGVPVSCDVAMHHLVFTVADLVDYDPNYKVWPPLRSADDRAALRAGLADGTVDAIVSDHQPHHYEDKARVYADAATGISSLETTLSLALGLSEGGALTPARLVELLSRGPRAVLGLPPVQLAAGGVADLTAIDPDASWIPEVSTLESRGANTPLLGQVLTGRAALTLVGGRVVWRTPADTQEA